MSKVILFLLFLSLSLSYAAGQVPIGSKADISKQGLVRDSLNRTKSQPAAHQLKEVNVWTSTPILERKVDRIVYNAANSIAAMGTDALELLAKIPGVKVQNDKISLVGKGSVNVMVNDRLIQLTEAELYTYLKSISSDQISKVEIITNPAAKYDAQGNNGLINIVFKKNKNDGLLAIVNLDNSLASHYTAAAGLNANYKKDKLTLSGNLNFRKGSIAPTEQTDIYYPTQTWKTMNNFRNFRTVPSGQLGIDYQLNKTTLLGVSYNASHTNLHSEETIKTIIFNRLDALDSLLVSDAKAKISSGYQSANLFFKHALDTSGKQLFINGDWFTYQDDRARNFNNNTYFNNGEINAPSFAEYLSASAQQMYIYTLKTDVDLPFKHFKVSFGGKLSFIHNQSDVAFYQATDEQYVADNSQTNHFDYTENTQALYGTFNKTLHQWAFQLGLRGEYTQTTGISQNSKQQNSYLQIFPTAFATYQMDQKNLFSFSYGRRINRPNYKKLNPFRWYSNQYAYMEGNPFLKPSYSNNLELSHTYASLFNTTLSFSQTNNGYSDINFTAPSSTLQVLRPENFIRSTSYQYSNSLALSPQSWWQSNTQLSIFYRVSKSSLTQTAGLLDGTGAYFSTSNQFYLNAGKTIAADLNLWYQFNGIDGVQQLERQYNVDLGFKVMLLQKKLQMTLNQTDWLKTNRYRYSSTINGIKQQYDNYYDARQLKLSIRYSFGNERIKSSNRKQGNEEERKRSN